MFKSLEQDCGIEIHRRESGRARSRRVRREEPFDSAAGSQPIGAGAKTYTGADRPAGQRAPERVHAADAERERARGRMNLPLPFLRRMLRENLDYILFILATLLTIVVFIAG